MKIKNEKIILDSSSVIGFFDSGIGGLTVLREFISLPIAQCIYVADTANMPYGSKSLAEIKEYSEHIVNFLLEQGATTIIISCHTATALALKHVQKTFKNKNIVGVVDLVSQEAAQRTKNNKIGIIATQATINSGEHKKCILSHNPKTLVFEQACPLLASAIEFGTHQGEELDTLVLNYIQPLLDAKIDTLILGSTHYDVIKNIIGRLTHNALNLISAHELIMQKFALNTCNNTIPNLHYYVTGDENAFLNAAKKILTINTEQITKLEVTHSLDNKKNLNNNDASNHSSLSGIITSSIL